MSNPLTEHHDAESPVQFSTVWRGMAILAFAMLSFITAGLFSWGVWVTVTVNSHDKLLAVLQERSHKGISQSVNVGEIKESAALTDQQGSAKSWLTTKDVATREGITERTVINYIEQGMIEPAPRKTGKAWEIAEHFRIIPKDAENCGEFPQGPEIPHPSSP